MPDRLFRRLLVPVASPADAEATGRAVARYLDDADRVIAVHVVEKAGGAPDKASVEQREEYAENAFDAFRVEVEDAVAVETRVTYGTDVADALIETAHEEDATAIAFTPRGGSRWVKLLTGDVATSLIEDSDIPVFVLPERGDEDG